MRAELRERRGAEAEGAAARFAADRTHPAATRGTSATPAAPGSLAHLLTSASRLRTTGQPLPTSLRTDLEAETGVDLTPVRAHPLPPGLAARTRDDLSFSVGPDIVLGSPHGLFGDLRLVRHEVAHVIQSYGIQLPQGDGGLSTADRAAIQQWLAAQDTGQAWPDPALFPPMTGPGSFAGQSPPFRAATSSGTTAPAGDVCPNCHQSPQEIRDAARRREEQRRAQAAAARRHGDWVASHAAEHSAFLTGQQTTLSQDIRLSKEHLVEQRMAMLAAAGARHGDVPPELAGAWASAYQESVVLGALVAGNQLTPEEAATARAQFVRFYSQLVPVAERIDARQADRERLSLTFAHASQPRSTPCPNCHTPNPSQPVVYRAPPPVGPFLRANAERVAAAAEPAQWQAVLTQFERDTRTMDSIVLGTLSPEEPAAQSFTGARDLLTRQEELFGRIGDAARVKAVFYPEDKMLTVNRNGDQVEIADGIPWYFYLSHTPTPDPYTYPDGFRWRLEDVTAPRRPVVSYAPSDVERALRAGQLHVNDVPRVLFEKLNDSDVFPRGVLYWRYPNSNRTDHIETTEPWSLSTWLSAIGLTLAALGFILATGGLATPGVLAALGVASAAFSVASTLAELEHKAELGILTPEDRRRAVLFIAADIASALSLGLGHAAADATRAAAAAGRATRLTIAIQRAAKVASALDKTLGRAVLVTMSAEFVQQYQTIMSSNLSDSEREQALHQLTSSALLTGAIVLGPHAVSTAVGAIRGTTPHPPSSVDSDVPGGHPHVPGDGTHVPTGGEPHVELPPPAATVVHGGTDAPLPGWSRSTQEGEFLRQSTKRETLPPDDAARELQIAQQSGQQRELPNDPEFDRQIQIGDHTWREQRGTNGGWCRFTTRRCYPGSQLRVGVLGRGDRVTAATRQDVVRLRQTLGQRPVSVRSEAAQLDWADYVFYAERRLQAIESALAQNRTPPPPPRTFASFRTEHPVGSIVRNEIQGTRFERRTRAAIDETLPADRAQLILAQHHLSEVLNPTVAEGMLTRPDQLFPDAGGTWTAVSNKSRTSFAGMRSQAVSDQVVNDLLEAVSKYSGTQHVRRTGETIQVTRIWLLYDAAGVPERLRPAVRRTVTEFGRMHANSGLSFEVGIF